MQLRTFIIIAIVFGSLACTRLSNWSHDSNLSRNALQGHQAAKSNVISGIQGYEITRQLFIDADLYMNFEPFGPADQWLYTELWRREGGRSKREEKGNIDPHFAFVPIFMMDVLNTWRIFREEGGKENCAVQHSTWHCTLLTTTTTRRTDPQKSMFNTTTGGAECNNHD